MAIKLSDKAEELLENLWITQEDDSKEDRSEAIGQVGDENELSSLVAGGLAIRQNGAVQLTGAGLAEARAVVRRHRLAERLLADVLDVGGTTMDEVACGFEHSLSSGVEEAICTLLGHPRVCPHGKLIPEGECCRERTQMAPRAIAPLADMQPGEGGKIAYVHTEEARKLQKLMAMGVLPGRTIKLVQRFPSHVFWVSNSQFAVDEEIARTIYVRIEGR